MFEKKMIAMMLTLSMLAAAFAGCLGGDDAEEDWTLTPAADVSAVYVTSDWDPIIPNLNDGTMCEAILSTMTITVAREEVVDFTRGYYTSSQGVIGGSSAAAISSVADLNAAGTTVALQSGTTSDLYAADNLGAATIVAFADFPSVIAAIDNGDADYALGDAPVLALAGTILAVFSDENYGIAVAEDDNGELLDALNVAISAVIDSGEHDLIAGAWDLAAPIVDDTTADTATAYPTPTADSTLTTVLERGTLKFCSDTSYPPFENLDADGNAEGFSIDLGNAIVDEIAAHYMGTANPTYVPPVVAGCTDSTAANYNSAANSDDGSCVAATTKIGLLNPMTGPIAVYAPPFTVAAQMAIDDLNAAGGNFELVEADSGCDGTVAATAAQSLVDAGVIGVAGAACSGASMAANAVLNAAGVVQVSYASTNPGLSDSTAYPGFWRVVPSDAIQGPAMADMVTAAGATNPALLHMTNDYGSGLADAFEGAWGATNLCTKIGYEDTTTEFAAQVQAIADASCSSVVMVTYSTDGAAILETMAVLGLSVPVFGADGIADSAFLGDFSAPGAANGVQATKPRAGSSAGDFNDRCAADTSCAGGIYTGETYDAVMMIGAAHNMGGDDMAGHLNMVGTAYAGASGTHTFTADGDVGGAGYDICRFDALSSTDVYFSCRSYWTLEGGIAASEFTGTTVKIGFLNPMTGPIAVYAPGFTAAAAISIQLANIAGYGSGLQFELVMADSGCDGTVAATAAQTLIDAGVVAVAGAACSGASMAANAVLSAAGIPMISYASTNPGLSDATAYPDFFRVVPSDALQGPALSDVVGDGGSNNPALLYMTNDYGSGFADSFEAAWGGSDFLCTKQGYADTATDFSAQVQAVMDNGCDSVVLISYAADGAQIIEDLATAGFTGSIYGGDGIAEEGLCVSMASNATCAGVVATKPASATPNERSMAFAALCGAIPDCAGGIYTAEAFDALAIIGFSIAALASSPPGTPLSAMIAAVGNGFVGASGIHTFAANGDVGGNGYCIGDFTVTDGVASFDCNRHISVSGNGDTGPITDA